MRPRKQSLNRDGATAGIAWIAWIAPSMALLLTLLTLLTAGCAPPADAPATQAEAGGAAPPQPRAAEPLSTYAAQTLAGTTVQLADFEGSVVLLNVWATWCPPCRRELPELQQLHERLADQGLRVIAVSIDDAAAETVVTRFVGDLGLTFTILRDPENRATQRFGGVGLPQTLLLDRTGSPRWRHDGPLRADDPELAQWLTKLL